MPLFCKLSHGFSTFVLRMRFLNFLFQRQALFLQLLPVSPFCGTQRLFNQFLLLGKTPLFLFRFPLAPVKFILTLFSSRI